MKLGDTLSLGALDLELMNAARFYTLLRTRTTSTP
jgi:hypothetical protein